MVDVQEYVRDQAREAIRDSRIDPQAEPGAIREVIAQAVEAASAGLPPGDHDGGDHAASTAETDSLLAEITADLAGHGPLQPYFDDPTVEEIWINNPGRVFVARDGRSELTSTILTRDLVRDLVERMLSSSGRRLDVSSPFVDAALRDGSRLHVVIPDVTREHWAVNIRRFVVRARSVADLQAVGMVTSQAAQFLTAAVVSGLNIVIAGSTQAGKTTLLNALLGSVPTTERIVTCEETFELSVPDHPDWVALQTRQAGLEGNGEITLRQLVREALRMRPTRLIVGEVRQQEALELLIAMNSGMPSMATIHANSAREAVAKLCTLPLLAGTNITTDFVQPTVASCVDLVVHLKLDAAGRRVVNEIAAVPGRVEAGVIELESIFVTSEGRLTRADGVAPHTERFAAAGFDLVTILAARGDDDSTRSRIASGGIARGPSGCAAADLPRSTWAR